MVRCSPRRAQNGYAAAVVAASSVPAVGISGSREFFEQSATEPAAALDRAATVAGIRTTPKGPTSERHYVMPTKRPIIIAKVDGVDRVGSGPVRFGKDWPGLFIRGDHAIKIAMCVRQLQTEIGGSPAGNGWALKFLAELATMIEDDVDTRSSASA